jgi:hypothetical protein
MQVSKLKEKSNRLVANSVERKWSLVTTHHFVSPGLSPQVMGLKVDKWSMCRRYRESLART